jgi:hypothetical protein
MTPEQSDPVRALIDVATERGIVSAAQRDALGALHAEVQSAPTVRVEAPRGLNSVTVSYVIGAMLVVFASAWFLADRWQSLGPWGVLGVVVVYAGLLVGCSVWLDRRGYRQASAIALMLAVTLTPVATWSLQVITGLWPASTLSNWLDDSNQWMSVCWVVVDLTTLLAALLAFRWRPSVALTIPMTVMLWGLALHLSRAVAGEYLVGSLDRWLLLADGLLVCAVAGEVDRWQVRERSLGRGRDGDFAFFFWLGGLFAFAIGYMSIWENAGAWRHFMVVVALILITLSLFLRRRTHLAFGLLALFGYLAFLALDVFREYLSLPAILGTLGVLLILATVWVQRRFPRLVERVNAEREGAMLPPMVTRGPFILAFGIAMLSIMDVKADMEQQAFRQRLQVLRQRSGSDRSQAPRGRARPQSPGSDSSHTDARGR